MLTPVPPTDCMRAREAVSVRLDGELGELEGVRLDGHLRRCPECRAFAAHADSLAAALRGALLESAPPLLFSPRERRRLRVPAAAAAGAVIAAIGFSFAVGQMIGSSSHGRALSLPPASSSASLDPGLLAMLNDPRELAHGHRFLPL